MLIKFENPNNGRFYYVNVQRDLLNHNVIIVYRGGIGGLSFHRTVYAGNEIDINIQKICKKRLQRGYILVS